MAFPPVKTQNKKTMFYSHYSHHSFGCQPVVITVSSSGPTCVSYLSAVSIWTDISVLLSNCGFPGGCPACWSTWATTVTSWAFLQGPPAPTMITWLSSRGRATSRVTWRTPMARRTGSTSRASHLPRYYKLLYSCCVVVWDTGWSCSSPFLLVPLPVSTCYMCYDCICWPFIVV